MMDSRLLIIAPYQFGELSDYYYWAKYAVIEGWDVTYIGYKYGKRGMKERVCPGVKIKSVKHYRNRFILGVFFYLRCVVEIVFNKHNNVFVSRMPFCELLPIVFPKRNIILDIRTLSVSQDAAYRNRQDMQLRTIARRFHCCSVISEGVGRVLGRSYNVIPLGAEELSVKKKTFDKIRLLYIGTFNNRSLDVFIDGLARYQKESGDTVTFDIVGGGDNKEVSLLKERIDDLGVEGVTMHGYLNHEEAKPLFDKCNVGVCYIPVRDYYQNQPPTKLYEYLLSGMAVISTNTVSNIAVMNEKNGIVIEDNAESVCLGLKTLAKQLSLYKSDEIVENARQYHWENIVRGNVLALAK